MATNVKLGNATVEQIEQQLKAAKEQEAEFNKMGKVKLGEATEEQLVKQLKVVRDRKKSEPKPKDEPKEEPKTKAKDDKPKAKKEKITEVN